MEIIRGTTPILIFTFDSITVSDVSVAYLTIKQNNEIILSKDIQEASVGEKTISWQLSQQDTLSLMACSAVVYCDWKLNSGVRGASAPLTIGVSSSGKVEVI